MLQILDIKKSFGELHVLRGVDLDVEQGDVVAIIGPSGSGKTALLRCINFLEKADSGTLIFDNEKFEFDKITTKEIARLRRKTAFVFQNYNLFLNKTALQNVTEGLIVARKMHKAEAIEIGKKALDKVGLSDRYDYYPSQLSGGQQQRVAIARAIATNPEIIFFDEPKWALPARSQTRSSSWKTALSSSKAPRKNFSRTRRRNAQKRSCAPFRETWIDFCQSVIHIYPT